MNNNTPTDQDNPLQQTVPDSNNTTNVQNDSAANQVNLSSPIDQLSTQQTTPPSDTALLSTQVGYCKPVLGILKGRAYGRDDTLQLFNDRVVYTSVQNSSQSVSIPITSIKKVKQRMQELWIYTNDGNSYTFEFGDPLATTKGALVGSGIGLAVMSNGVSQSGINDWFDMLQNKNIAMDDSAYNTSGGMLIKIIRTFIWIILITITFMLIIATYALIIGADGGKPGVFIVEIPIFIACVFALKKLPSGKS